MKKSYYLLLHIAATLALYLMLSLVFSGMKAILFFLVQTLSIFVLAMKLKFQVKKYNILCKICVFIFTFALLFIVYSVDDYLVFVVYGLSGAQIVVMVFRVIIALLQVLLLVEIITKTYDQRWVKINTKASIRSLCIIIVTTIFIEVGYILVYGITDDWLIKAMNPKTIMGFYGILVGNTHPLVSSMLDAIKVLQLTVVIVILWNSTYKRATILSSDMRT